MAKFSRRRLAREVVRLLLEQPGRKAEIVQQLAGYLIANRMVGKFDLLMMDIADEQYLQAGQLQAEAEHVFDLSDATRQAIASLLKDASGAKAVELQTTVNPSLLGGVIIRTPRQELDASLRRKLNLIAGGIE